MSGHNDRDIFFSIHRDLPREGPGDRASTHRAYRRIARRHAPQRILDLGCGPGAQTIDLANVHAGLIVAVDTHAPYLDVLLARSVAAGVADRVRAVRASMFALAIANASVDVIWAEGSIYIPGFEAALRQWKPLLKAGGYVAATHLSWLRDDIPDEPRAFWTRHYPAIASVESNEAVARRCGFEVVEAFALPESAWWDDYYGPMEQRLGVLRAEHEGDEEAVAIIDGTQSQIDLYRRFSSCYGYVFYVLRAA